MILKDTWSQKREGALPKHGAHDNNKTNHVQYPSPPPPPTPPHALVKPMDHSENNNLNRKK